MGPSRARAWCPPTSSTRRNGLQFLPFNTVYQLAADPLASPSADRLLLVPDLLGYWLTGREVAERTNASTTGLLDRGTGRWDDELIAGSACRATVFAELVDPATMVGDAAPPRSASPLGADRPAAGRGRLPRHRLRGGRRTRWRATPRRTSPAAPGAWSASSSTRRCSPRRPARPTSPTRAASTAPIRFLTNVMGTWLLSETLRAWDRDRPARDAAGRGRRRRPAPVPVFDVQDPRFLPPGDMPARIAAWCAEHDVRRARRRRDHGAQHRREPGRGVRRRRCDTAGDAVRAHRHDRPRRRRRRARTPCSARRSPTGPGCRSSPARSRPPRWATCWSRPARPAP